MGCVGCLGILVGFAIYGPAGMFFLTHGAPEGVAGLCIVLWWVFLIALLFGLSI